MPNEPYRAGSYGPDSRDKPTSYVVDPKTNGCFGLFWSLADAEKTAAALNTPTNQELWEVIERAEKTIHQVAHDTEIDCGEELGPGCWWCGSSDGEPHSEICKASKLLADITRLREGRDGNG